VVHFNRNVLGEHFLAIPEMKAVAQLLNKNNGIQLVKGMRKEMAETIPLIEKATGFQRLDLLLQSLQKIANTNQYQLLTLNFAEADNKVNPAIEKIIDYSFKHYLNAITLQEVAAVAQMSIPTFCRFFKKNIKKTYFEFLQDIRISHACKLLNSTNKPIMEICYESGYNSWAHFSKQFKEIKATTPSQYRKQFEV
jgi:AraC-like DNA-binding protein